LGADQVGDRVVDRCAQEDDVLLEQPAVEVVGPLAPVGLLDHRGHEVVADHVVVLADGLGHGAVRDGYAGLGVPKLGVHHLASLSVSLVSVSSVSASAEATVGSAASSCSWSCSSPSGLTSRSARSMA